MELLRSVERYEPPSGQKQRVSARLLARGSARRGRLIRAPLAFAMLLCAAGASAAVSGPWIARGYRALIAPSHPESSAARVATKPAAKSRPPARPQLAVVEAPPAQAAEALPSGASDSVEPTTALPPVQPVRASRNARGTREEPARATRPRANAESEAGSLVFGAMQALRREGQPERAAKLLEEYRRRYPNGALGEEALALSVEAAVQRGDPRAKALAESYLARFPNGQFRQAAERARALSSP